MKTKYWVSLLSAPLMLAVLAVPTYAKKSAEPVACTDGTTSAAKGRGACSGHGGVKKDDAAAPAAAAPAAAAEPAKEKKSKKAKESAPAAAAPAAAAGAMTNCKDGTTSEKSGRGACSGHGGVAKAGAAPAAAAPVAAAPAAPAAVAPAAKAAPVAAPAASKSAPTEAASASDPAGATAKCKDGTFSHSKVHTGACSHHGGVADWLTPAN